MSILELPDIQQTAPEHAITINWVGIRRLRYPIALELGANSQRTVAEFSLAVSLPPNERGTHMSRFVEEVAATRRSLSAQSLLAGAERLAARLETDAARVDITFPFFLEREAPASGSVAAVDYDGAISAVVSPAGRRLALSVKVPVTSLCPCSKEISDYGAHSQRGYVSITVSAVGEAVESLLMLDFTYLVAVAEQAASAPIYSLLKRSDERHVTMQAYDQPAFVEDVVRSVAAILSAEHRIASFAVDVENQESIHNHSAFAVIA
jgi:GTP cyclohydrolase IB